MQAFFKSQKKGALKNVKVAFDNTRYDNQGNALNGREVEYRCTWVTQTEAFFSQ